MNVTLPPEYDQDRRGPVSFAPIYLIETDGDRVWITETDDGRRFGPFRDYGSAFLYLETLTRSLT